MDDPALRAVVCLVSIGPADREQDRECSATSFLID
jgi:hypothetical protein